MKINVKEDNEKRRTYVVCEDVPSWRIARFMHMDESKPDAFGSYALYFKMKTPWESVPDLEEIDVRFKGLENEEYEPTFKVNVNNDERKNVLPEISIINSRGDEIFLEEKEFYKVEKSLSTFETIDFVAEVYKKDASKEYCSLYLKDMKCYSRRSFIENKRRRDED